MAYNVFISYSTKNLHIVQWAVNTLTQSEHIAVFAAEYSVRPGHRPLVQSPGWENGPQVGFWEVTRRHVRQAESKPTHQRTGPAVPIPLTTSANSWWLPGSLPPNRAFSPSFALQSMRRTVASAMVGSTPADRSVTATSSISRARCSQDPLMVQRHVVFQRTLSVKLPASDERERRWTGSGQPRLQWAPALLQSGSFAVR
jgi:hypothetical protein